MADQTGSKTKEVPTAQRKPTIGDIATQIREDFGRFGGPLADALLIVAAQVETSKKDLSHQVEIDSNEMRGYAHGARASAEKTAASAEQIQISVATLHSEYAGFLSELEAAGDKLASSAANAEESALHAQSSLETIQTQTTPLITAIESLTRDGAQGVEALLQILGSVDKIPEAIKAAVESIIFIDVEATGPGGVKSAKRLVGSDALRYFRSGLSLVSQTAGDAIRAANDAKSGLEELNANVAAGLANVDNKLTLLMLKMQNAGIDFSEEEVAGIVESSYADPKPAAPEEPANTTATKGDT